jgi:hypothetical protein
VSSAKSAAAIPAAPFAAPHGGDGPPPAVRPVTVLAIGLVGLALVGGGLELVRLARHRRRDPHVGPSVS